MNESWLGTMVALNVVVFLGLKTALALYCPAECRCYTDAIRRKQVRCEKGGIHIPNSLDIQSIDSDTEVLVVSGSWNNHNTFLLEPEMFAGKGLKEIHLSFSKLEHIGESPFRHVHRTLEVLNLTHNQLRYVVEQNFGGPKVPPAVQLTHLHLDYNNIEPMFTGQFKYAKALRVWTMSHNHIREMVPRMAYPLENLEVLDLSFNPLGDRFAGFPVNVNREPLPSTIFADMPNLKALRLVNTSSESMPWAAMGEGSPQLRELDLSDNNIKHLGASDFSLNKALQAVKLSNNPIKTIDSGTFSGLSLQYLHLTGIRAGALLPGVFSNANVSFLDISNTSLSSFSLETFGPLAADLNTLDISANPQIKLRPKMFAPFSKLKNLSMAGTIKGQIPDDFFAYPNVLQNLDLSRNKLGKLSDEFFSQTKDLINLKLGSSQLTAIPLSVQNLSKIQAISFRNNRISVFPESVLMAFTNSQALGALRLNLNPWQCDCAALPLIRWLTQEKGHQIVCTGTGNATCPLCETPDGLKGVPLDRALVMIDACTTTTTSTLSPLFDVSVDNSTVMWNSTGAVGNLTMVADSGVLVKSSGGIIVFFLGVLLAGTGIMSYD
ncbi:leucine-rich repeat-containing protein 15-like [Paramacrobiotus metropolitanus]|uniref:leucine-rich repeat-containing protein 15-like n=1 Tax=Paramacrobiotus metropolitanus TaxID=2943436 RepID=UPI002445EE98|nr:leucine-rich repeat-containing protein 15-like [Paramacrobiotus metropolitanus]